MAFVYILQSQKNGRYYLGSTENLENRLKEHYEGKVYTTKRMLPIELVFRQEYSSIEVAENVEQKLKSFKSKIILEKIIKEGKIKISGCSDVSK